jgi:hypothetical protein
MRERDVRRQLFLIGCAVLALTILTEARQSSPKRYRLEAITGLRTGPRRTARDTPGQEVCAHHLERRRAGGGHRRTGIRQPPSSRHRSPEHRDQVPSKGLVASSGSPSASLLMHRPSTRCSFVPRTAALTIKSGGITRHVHLPYGLAMGSSS